MEILLNNNFTTNENITTTGSSLSYKNGYYINSEIGRGDLTTEFNIQEFLNNPNNLDLTTRFLEFIKNNFNQNQIIEINNNNLSLSNSLNSYYNTIYRNNLFIPDLVKPKINYSSETVTYNVLTFSENQEFFNNKKSGVKYVLSADSYYVDIFLSESFQTINNPKKEISKTTQSGLTQVKNVSYIQNVYNQSKNTYETIRLVNLSNEPYILLNGFVFPNLSTSLFSNFSPNGIDVDVSTFQGVPVYEIFADLSGNTSYSESLEPKGVVNVLLGGNKTFIFRTTDINKQIDKVIVDGQQVEYERYNNESKLVVGQYTFNNVDKNHKIVVYFI
jgi:hypothetical protein